MNEYMNININDWCLSQGSTKESEPVGDIYEEIYCKELVYVTNSSQELARQV